MPAMKDDTTIITKDGASKRPHEFRNLMCLAVIYGTYFISTQGCMQVFQLASQFLRDDEEVHKSIIDSLPMTIQLSMAMLLAVPYALLFQKVGRQKAFMLAAMIAGVGFILGFISLRVKSFVHLCISVVFFSPFGIADYVRFAAADFCAPQNVESAVANVMLYGAIISSLGPLFAALLSYLIPDDQLGAYSFYLLFCGVLAVVNFTAASFIRPPPELESPKGMNKIAKIGQTDLDLEEQERDSSTSDEIGKDVETKKVAKRYPPPSQWLGIFCRRKVLVAFLAQLSVHFCMIMPTGGLVLHMEHALGLGNEASIETSTVLILHTFGMFGTGLISAPLIKMFGGPIVILCGFLIQCVAAALCLIVPQHQLWVYYVSLYLTGVGWNFAFVSGSVLLTAAPDRADDRFIVQSINEVLRSCSMVAATLLSNVLPWVTMQILILSVLSAVGCITFLHFVTLNDPNVVSFSVGCQNGLQILCGRANKICGLKFGSKSRRSNKSTDVGCKDSNGVLDQEGSKIELGMARTISTMAEESTIADESRV